MFVVRWKQLFLGCLFLSAANTKSPSDHDQLNRLWDGSQVRALQQSNIRLGNFILQNHKYQISAVKKIFIFFKSSPEERKDLSFLTSVLQNNFSSFSRLYSNQKRASHKKLLTVTPHSSKNFSHICNERVSLVGQCKDTDVIKPLSPEFPKPRKEMASRFNPFSYSG